MIYTFKSRAAADLKMTGPVGDRVLSLIGKGPSAQGIIDVDQIPEALRATPRAEDHVSLRQRVWPMVEMMKLSLTEKQPIVWGV